MENVMTLVRNAKGQFVKKAAVVEVAPLDLPTARAQFQDEVLKLVQSYAAEVYGSDAKKAVLKAYRAIFDASYVDSYAWGRSVQLPL